MSSEITALSVIDKVEIINDAPTSQKIATVSRKSGIPGSKRKVLSVIDKVEIINEVQSGQKITAVSRKYGLSCSTVCTLLKNKETLLNAFDRNIIHSKRLKKPGKPDLDEVLFRWFVTQHNYGLPTNGPTMKAQAEEFASQLGYDKFACTNGWLHRFKMRHNIFFKKEEKTAIENHEYFPLADTDSPLQLLDSIESEERRICVRDSKLDGIDERNMDTNEKANKARCLSIKGPDATIQRKKIKIDDQSKTEVNSMRASDILEARLSLTNGDNINGICIKNVTTKTDAFAEQLPSSFLKAATGCVDILQHYFEVTDNSDNEAFKALDVIREKLTHAGKKKTTLTKDW